MGKNSRSTETNSGAETPIRITYGEVFENAVIDIVASAEGTDRDGLNLLFWGGGKVHVASEIKHRGIVYRAPDLDSSIRQAMRFPPGATAYGSFTTLFKNVANLYRQHLGLPEDMANFTTSWNFSTCIPELMLIPPTLAITASRCQVRNLFRMFHSLCRRSLMVAQLSRHLPIHLGPTLLVDDPTLSPKACAFWSAANSPGMVVPATGGKLCELACSKAVHLQPQDSPDLWGEEVMHLMPPPAEFPPLSSRLLEDIAAEFQPQLEMFRLRRLIGQETFATPSSPLSDRAFACNLYRCIPDDAGIVQSLTPLLESQQQEVLARRARNPQLAIITAVWVPAHKPGKMSVSEITDRVNAILFSAGEMYVLNCREIGWQLRKLRLWTHSTSSNRVLQFSTEIRQRLHQLGREFGLQLPTIQGCPECMEAQVIDS